MALRKWWDDPWGYLEDVYLDNGEAWTTLAAVLRAATVFGLDTEFYGLDVRKESCVGRARVHVWSVAVRTKTKSPLGFHYAVGWVLPAAALQHPELKAVLEDPSITKPCHNQPVDDHAIHNHGVKLVGCRNTLGWSRWVWPWFVSAEGFGLKALMQVKLHRAPICEFKDVVSDARTIQVTKQKKVTKSICSCGEAGCRKRKADLFTTHDKSKVTEVVEETVEKEEKFQHPLESIVPGHPRWELLVRYAAEDAVAALEIDELAAQERDPAPWPYEDNGAGPANIHLGRPKFSQAIEDSVVLMERNGFPVDTEYAREKAIQAEADQEKELAWLHTWYVVNGAPTYGPHRREEVDGIWSSPKQLGVLFDDLDFPRSPIWKKGRVKPGEIKLDAAALKWIAKNHNPSKQVIEHILRLKIIRSGKKYLLKLRDCGGWVNVICGPAGDADDRNGAVTGRLGIKGVIEAQQLPTKEELDLYQVRRAIVAQDMRAV